MKYNNRGVDWFELAQDIVKGWDVANKVINFGVPSNEGNFSTNCRSVNFSIKKTPLDGVFI